MNVVQIETLKSRIYDMAPVLLDFNIDFRMESKLESPITVIEFVDYNHKILISHDSVLGIEDMINMVCYDLLFYLFLNHKISSDVFHSHGHILFGKEDH